jgi:4-amino-4-deoxy-L-arabinose transferase-like glycosyltransferase
MPENSFEAQPSVRTTLKASLLLAGIFALASFLLHLLTSLHGEPLGYGYFRDELYYLVCGRHLDWGFVDHPPLVALQARLAELLFGLTPTSIRIFSFIAGALTVAITGLITRQLGGNRISQALAMTAVFVAPVFVVNGSYLSMNSVEPLLWMSAMLVLLRIIDGSADQRAWVAFGVFAGLGIENKHSTVFFLVALVLGLLLSPQRRILFSRWCAVGVGVLLLIALPNLIWQILHHFPTYELLSGIAKTDKNVKLPPLAFIFQQFKMLFVTTGPLWVGGLAWAAFARKGRSIRFLAPMFLIFFAMMMAMHAKDYYLSPIYPVMFAAGAAALSLTQWPLWARGWVVGVEALWCLFLLLIFTIAAPLFLTILPPAEYGDYAKKLHADLPASEKFTSPLPQFFSDRFGWPQMVKGFAERYNALPPELRAKTAIFCGNYGEASAVNILGPQYGLPTAISGHQNYFYWGWNGYTGESVLTLGNDPKDYSNYGEVIDLGTFDAPYIMDHEHHHYYWLKHRNKPYSEEWPTFKYWY